MQKTLQDKELLALKDILPFCRGRIKFDKNKNAYRDIIYLTKQHINILSKNKS